MAEQQKAVQGNVIASEVARQVIKKVLLASKELGIKEEPSQTGFSYFAGKKRICKLLNTKRGVSLEINVVLPKELAELPEMDRISIERAKAKHLGTMKHFYRGGDAKLIPSIMEHVLKAHLAEIAPVKKEEPVQEAKAN